MKTKVAVVGGGCAALTTAYELSKDPRYEITVYQLGWRLGGKAASGRNVAEGGRIEEHGLHIWLGFYENAFRLLRDCYRELDEMVPLAERISRFQRIEDAFIATNTVGVVNSFDNGDWRTWLAYFPPTPGMPGDELTDEDNPFTLQRYVSQALKLLQALIGSLVSPAQAPGLDVNPVRGARRRAVDLDRLNYTDATLRLKVAKMYELFRTGALCSLSVLLEAMTLLELACDMRFGLPGEEYVFVELVSAVADNTRKLLEQLVSADPSFRLRLDIVELVMATVVGIVRDGLLTHPQGLDAIDSWDCRAWLARHGASARACNSGFVRALYAMAFADTPTSPRDVPGIAAGQALRGAFRMFFTYRGALFWKMRSSMGEVMFVPLYELLKRRNVKFKFFHRLVGVHLEDPNNGSNVASLDFQRQATIHKRSTSGGAAALSTLLCDWEYYPLDDHNTWPSRPLAEQLDSAVVADATLELQNGRAEETITLKRGDDFHYVVLGVSVDVIARTCKELSDADTRWRAMLRMARTVGTQSAQLWLDPGLEELGWRHGPALVSGIPGALDTWADMTHIVAREEWGDAKPKSLSYFCSALPPEEQGLAEVPTQNVKLRLEEFLRQQAPRLWGRTSPVQLPADRYVYVRTNVDASDRYVLSRPDSLRYRISPLDDRFTNLTIAGDWTSCGFNEGCVEAAVMSGLLAAHALTGKPNLEAIIGYDHP